MTPQKLFGCELFFLTFLPLEMLFLKCDGFVSCRCWMKVSHQALLAQGFTTMTVLALLVSSGMVILFLVFREIRTRDEWKQRRVAFLSIWGLSCLFGSTWCLIFLDFEPLSDFIHFLFCILNSFQGLFGRNPDGNSPLLFVWVL